MPEEHALGGQRTQGGNDRVDGFEGRRVEARVTQNLTALPAFASRRGLVVPQRGTEQRALIETATEQARAVAEATPLPTPRQPLPKAKPPRTRYWPDNRIVDLVDFPFGVALWSPYDAQLNEVVRTWCRASGGGGSVPTRTGSFQSKPSRSWSPRSPSAKPVRRSG